VQKRPTYLKAFQSGLGESGRGCVSWTPKMRQVAKVEPCPRKALWFKKQRKVRLRRLPENCFQKNQSAQLGIAIECKLTPAAFPVKSLIGCSGMPYISTGTTTAMRR